jgi:hypothetical protein
MRARRSAFWVCWLVLVVLLCWVLEESPFSASLNVLPHQAAYVPGAHTHRTQVPQHLAGAHAAVTDSALPMASVRRPPYSGILWYACTALHSGFPTRAPPGLLVEII